MDAAPLAMRACQIGLKSVIDEFLRFISSAPLANSIDQLAALRRGEFRDQFRQPPFEFPVFHDRSPIRRTNQELHAPSISILSADRAFAKKEAIEYELILASHGEHVHEKVLHIQTVNSYISRFKKWLDRFNGVATKYLSNYLNWRQMLEKSATPLTPEHCLVAAMG